MRSGAPAMIALTVSIPALTGGFERTQSKEASLTGSYKCPLRASTLRTRLISMFCFVSQTALSFTSTIITRRLGLNVAAAIPTAPYPHPMSRTHPSSGRIMESTKSLVPRSRRFLEKTPEAVKNSNRIPRRVTCSIPSESLDFGRDEK